MNKFKGFTLAEVLITLGIIGVVAAITIPSLIKSYQKHVTITKLQKAISVLSQAYKLSYDDNGDTTAQEIYNMGPEEYFKTYWQPYIKTATICTDYKQCGYTSVAPWVTASGKKSNTAAIWSPERTTFYTDDGILYVIFTSSGATGGTKPDDSIYVDINGGGRPNRYGRDVFLLERGSGGVQPKGLKYLDSTINNNCSKTGSGDYCAEKIKRAGWKIDNSYPWK